MILYLDIQYCNITRLMTVKYLHIRGADNGVVLGRNSGQSSFTEKILKSETLCKWRLKESQTICSSLLKSFKEFLNKLEIVSIVVYESSRVISSFKHVQKSITSFKQVSKDIKRVLRKLRKSLIRFCGIMIKSEESKKF